MFSFIVRWLGFLKGIPLMAIYYDSLIKLWVLVTNPKLLHWIDDLEEFVLTLPQTEITLHKYGGSQFNFKGKEFAHLHSNGILDILFNQKLKKELLIEGKIEEHHVFKNTGWTSFYIKKAADQSIAKELLLKAYQRLEEK